MTVQAGATTKPSASRNARFVRVNMFRKLHPVLYFWCWFTLLLLLFVGIFLLNIRYSAANYTLEEIYQTISQPGWHNVSTTRNLQISTVLWQACATSVGALGLGVAGMVTQALVKNPIADASTLGISQAAVFGIVAIVSYGVVNYGAQYAMALAAGTVSVLLLFAMLFVSKGKISGYRIILAGLAIGIVFKTMTFFFKSATLQASSLNFAYVLGGAENIYYYNFSQKWTVLLISFVLIIAGSIVALFNSRSLTTLELGEGKARDLGVSVFWSRVLSIISLVLVTPSAVVIVGNLSFIGLFAAHFSRYLMGSRNYKFTMPLCILFAMFIGLMGMQLSERVPDVNSGLWMTFVGVPYLIYIAVRGAR